MAEDKVEKTVKRVCTCEKCGNESEMTVHCSLVAVEDEPAAEAKAPKAPEPRRAHGTGVCTHCGNEADMWVEL
jgi:hypothetical protein